MLFNIYPRFCNIFLFLIGGDFMMLDYYKILLSLHNCKYVKRRNNIICGYNIKTNRYLFYKMVKGRLKRMGECETKVEALFKFFILI